MLKTTIVDIPYWTEVRILFSLDFESLLSARATCRRWNDILQSILASRSRLNIHLDKTPASKKFRRGKWNGNLICPFQEIRIIPKPENAFLTGKGKRREVSALKHFNYVKKFTLFENGSFLHFIHRYMVELTTVKYVQIRELKFYGEEKAGKSKYSGIGHAYSQAFTPYKSWLSSLDNLCRIETLRIRLFDRTASLLYMNLFTFRATMLVNMELDFSKCYGLPFNRVHLNEIFCALCDILEYCHLTLRQLRMKWAIRVDTDLDFVRSDDDIEPFFEFMLCLRNPVWSKLSLEQLWLSFPTINLALNLCETSLYPFLHLQMPTLKRATFSRVVPNAGIEGFVTRFPTPALLKFEFSFYFIDTRLNPQPIPIIRGIEVLSKENSQIEFARMFSPSRSRREFGMRHCTQLKLINEHTNLNYMTPEIVTITEYFGNVRILELLNTSLYGRLFANFTNADFNMIVKRMGKLVSLKMSNAGGLGDVGITRIPQEKLKYMQSVGVYYLPYHADAPVARASELRYLDLRDLTSNLSDASVFFAFQHIKKLEKISFHGAHTVTSWSQKLLESKFKRNPYFDVIFKPLDNDHVTFGNYTMPCADFP